MIDVPYEPRATSALISQELHIQDLKADSTLSDDTIFPKSLKGLNNHTINLPDPIASEQLVVSDFIIGYGLQGDKSTLNGSEKKEKVNFNIAHDKKIPRERELNLYYEVYNLTPADSDGIAIYNFEYAIKQKKRGFLGIGKRTDDDQVSITVNNRVAASRDASELVIDTSEYETGDYELHVTVTDQRTGQTYSRILEFTIK